MAPTCTSLTSFFLLKFKLVQTKNFHLPKVCVTASQNVTKSKYLSRALDVMDAGSVRRLTWSRGRLPEMNEVRPYLLLTGRDPVVSSSAAMSAWTSVLWNTGVLTLTLTLTPTEQLDPSHSFTKWATLNGKLFELYRPLGAFLHGLIIKVWVHCSDYTIEIYCTLQHFSF